MAAWIVGSFDERLQSNVALAFFIPGIRADPRLPRQNRWPDDLIEASQPGNDVPVTCGDIRAAHDGVLGSSPSPKTSARGGLLDQWRPGNDSVYG